MKNSLFVLTLIFAVGGSCIAADKNFAGKDLTGKDLSNEPLDGADFSDATLSGTKFTGASLKNANFKDSVIKDAVFRNADMTGAIMSGLKPTGTFEYTNLSKSQWVGSVVPGARRCNFQEADLIKAKFAARYFNECDFRLTDLRGANLLGPELKGLNKCNWKGAKYDEDTAFPKGFDPKEEGMILTKPDVKKDDKK